MSNQAKLDQIRAETEQFTDLQFSIFIQFSRHQSAKRFDTLKNWILIENCKIGK